jgi:hypothetical protein
LPCSASCPGASSTCAAGRVLREFSALISSSWSFLACRRRCVFLPVCAA